MKIIIRYFLFDLFLIGSLFIAWYLVGGSGYEIGGEGLILEVVIFPVIAFGASLYGTMKSKNWFVMPLITFIVFYLFFLIADNAPPYIPIMGYYTGISLLVSISIRITSLYKTKKLKMVYPVIWFSLLLCGFVFLFFYNAYSGNPTLKEESKEIATEYLVTNYPEQSFTIEDVYYYDGNYNVAFTSKNGKIQGEISVRDGKIYVVGLYDEKGQEILYEVK